MTGNERSLKSPISVVNTEFRVTLHTYAGPSPARECIISTGAPAPLRDAARWWGERSVFLHWAVSELALQHGREAGLLDLQGTPVRSLSQSLRAHLKQLAFVRDRD
jgi:hypothetical protein